MNDSTDQATAVKTSTAQPEKVPMWKRMLGAVPPQPQPSPAAITQPAGNGGATTTTPPAPQAQPASEAGLDDWAKLMENAQKQMGTDQKTAPNLVDSLQKPEIMQQIVQASGLNAQVTPEVMQAFQAGDTEAVSKFFSDIQQQTFQAAFKQAALFGNLNAKQQMEALQSQLTSQVQQQITDSQLAELNPALQNPAVKQSLQLMKQAIISQNPNASASDINEALSAYVQELAGAWAPEEQAASQGTSEEPMDWNAWLNSDKPT